LWADIPIILNVDARKLHERDDLPFQKDREEGQRWVLWWQCPYVSNLGAGETLREFISSALTWLQPHDLIVIGWAYNWEYGEGKGGRKSMYEITALLEYSVENGFKVVAKEDEALAIELRKRGYVHRTNQGVVYPGTSNRMVALTKDYALQFRTLVLEKQEAVDGSGSDEDSSKNDVAPTKEEVASTKGKEEHGESSDETMKPDPRTAAQNDV